VKPKDAITILKGAPYIPYIIILVLLLIIGFRESSSTHYFNQLIGEKQKEIDSLFNENKKLQDSTLFWEYRSVEFQEGIIEREKQIALLRKQIWIINKKHEASIHSLTYLNDNDQVKFFTNYVTKYIQSAGYSGDSEYETNPRGK